MSKKAYDAGRKCDNCGAKSPPFWPRKRSKDGGLLCDSCIGKEALKVYYGGFYEGDPTGDLSFITDEELIREYKARKNQEERGEKLVDDDYRWFLAVVAELENRGYSSYTAKKVAHDSPGTDILRHCPFCGAGQLTGRSDGTAECGFCDAVFTVQTQPNLPATPQTVNDELYMHPEMSEPGVAEDEMDPSLNDPVGTELPLTEEESGSSGENPFDDIEKMTFRVGSTTVPSGEYIKHLALKHADNRMAVLRAVRASRR